MYENRVINYTTGEVYFCAKAKDAYRRYDSFIREAIREGWALRIQLSLADGTLIETTVH